MKHSLKKIFPWWFEDWDKVAKEKRKQLDDLFYRIKQESKKT